MTRRRTDHRGIENVVWDIKRHSVLEENQRSLTWKPGQNVPSPMNTRIARCLASGSPNTWKYAIVGQREFLADAVSGLLRYSRPVVRFSLTFDAVDMAVLLARLL